MNWQVSFRFSNIIHLNLASTVFPKNIICNERSWFIKVLEIQIQIIEKSFFIIKRNLTCSNANAHEN